MRAVGGRGLAGGLRGAGVRAAHIFHLFGATGEVCAPGGRRTEGGGGHGREAGSECSGVSFGVLFSPA